MKRHALLASVLLLAACQDLDNTPTALAPTGEPSSAATALVQTPSGAVFTQAEWAAKADKSPWLVPAAERVAAARKPQSRAGGPSLSVSGQAAPRVLCHVNGYICGEIPALLPGAQITYWGDAQWTSASASDFAQFDAIYLHDSAAGSPSIIASKNVWGSATSGRVALTGVHFEHCSAYWDPTSGPCRVLKASMAWIHAGEGTGLLMATQSYGSANQMIPDVAPYAGVTFAAVGGGWDLVRITDPGHATMQGSTDASLSNFFNSSHSIFGDIGGMTSVAEICSTGGSYPGTCSGGAWKSHFLVASVGVADQDGDGVGDSIDNCPTVGNPGQSDANGNGVGDACESAPSVTISPKTSQIAPGGSVTFSAAAQDADDALSSLTYEWRVDGIVQPGAASSTFTHSFGADATVRVTVRDPGHLSGFDDAAVTIQTDATAPVITPSVAGTAGDDGWYTSDAVLTWTVVDGESPISSQSGCTTATVDADDDGAAFTCTATSAGGTATETVTLKVDRTAPTVAPVVQGTLGNNGWYTSDVAVSFTRADPTSGIAASVGCATVSLESDTPGTTYSCKATNGAGLSNTASVSVKRDATAPVVAFSGNAGSYTVDQSIAIACSASDAGSGIASHGCADIEGSAFSFPLGVNTRTATATDRAGNSATATTSFTVGVTQASLCALVKRWVGNAGIANAMCKQLEGSTRAFVNHVEAQSGKAVSAANAARLIELAGAL